MLAKCVDGCNNIAIRIRMAVTDLRKDHVVVNSVAVDGCMGIFSRIIIVDKNVLGIDGCTGMVTKGVDGCNDVTSRMRIVDDGANRIRIIDHEI
jgi:hypothetical protein